VPPYLDLSGGLERLRRYPRCWRTPDRDGGPDRFAVRRHHREQIRPIGPRTPSAAELEAVAHVLACTDPQSVFSKSATLSDLTDEQLCKRWPPSYRASQRRMSALKLISGVAERQVYIDELEHRNSAGFAAWLTAGMEAAENPLPYLTGEHIDVRVVDRDQLTRGQG